MNLLARYRKLNLWSKLGAWGSIASIVGLLWFFIPSKATPPAEAKSTAATVSASPGATVMQSGRDIIVNNPPASKAVPDAGAAPKREVPRTSPRTSAVPTGPSQTMINSPGGIQAGGNVTVASDRRVLNSVTLRIAIETDTPPAQQTEVRTDVGLQSIIGLFTKDKTRVRFATDFQLGDQQVSETRRRLSFTYTPETPEEIMGKPVDFLSSIEVMAVNYTEIFNLKKFDTSQSKSQIQCAIAVNGIPVSTINTDIPAGVLSKGQANMNVAESFASIPAAYETAVARR